MFKNNEETDILKDLLEEERNRVLKVLKEIKDSKKPLTIKEIIKKTKLSYTKVTEALAILRERKLIKREVIGGRNVYSRVDQK
jgi:DNA-binding transcriptional ArsR family regulator